MDACVKQEVFDTPNVPESRRKNGVVSTSGAVIELSSGSSSSSDSDSDQDLDSLIGNTVRKALSPSVNGGNFKKPRTEELGVVLPIGFLSPRSSEPPPQAILGLPAPKAPSSANANNAISKHSLVNGDLNGSSKAQGCKQFWKAGDYDGGTSDAWDSSSGRLLFNT